MAIDLTEYRTLYIATARDLITTLEAMGDALESNPTDAESIAESHRAAHSLKGQSLVMGYTNMGLLSKILEGFFRKVKDGETTITQDDSGKTRAAVNALKNSLDAIAQTGCEADLTDHIQVFAQRAQIPTA